MPDSGSLKNVMQYGKTGYIGIAVLIAFLCCCCGKSTSRKPSFNAFITDNGTAGLFLEKLPGITQQKVSNKHVTRPSSGRGFSTSYRRIRTTDSRDPSIIRSSIFRAAVPRDNASITYSCSKIKNPVLRGWVHSLQDYTPGVFLAAAHDANRISLALPRIKRRLRMYSAPLPPDFCAGKKNDTLRIRIGRKKPEHARKDRLPVLAGPPVMVSDSEEKSPVVILISLDAMRRDMWDESTVRPESLEKFRRDSIRFRHAYASFPSTPQSHSVIFSGRYPADAVKKGQLEKNHSFVHVLQKKGFNTMGFVAGGYARANFGFNRRLPGFALGFDLYVEEIPTGRRRIRDLDPEERISRLYHDSHTLAPALERSIRWFRLRSGESAVHFIHCYDVHESHIVAKKYFDLVLRDKESGSDRDRLLECGSRLNLSITDDYGVFFPGPKPYIRKVIEKDPGTTDCYRRLITLMYKARIRSIQDTLAVYFDALRKLDVYDRAMIIVTSDHGESLLDEKDWDGKPLLGHNHLLANNMQIPLWIKLPGQRGEGRNENRIAGLVDIRATTGGVLDMNIGESDGIDLLDPLSQRNGYLKFSAQRGERGLVLENNDICVWKKTGSDKSRGKILKLYHDGKWAMLDPHSPSPCTEAAGTSTEDGDEDGDEDIPEDMKEELKALGYME